MRAAQILQNLFGSRLDFLHAGQLRVLLLVVEAAFRASQLTLTALGRALPSTAHPKHRIKRVDRLLANPHLRRARSTIFHELAAIVLDKHARPIIAVDWTQISEDEWALWAGVPFLGRAIPLYVEVVRIKRGVKRKAHRRFLENLRLLLPPDVSPILIIDAEFCTPFFDACAAMRFDFVVRLRGVAKLKGRPGQSTSAKSLAKTAKRRPRCAGRYATYDSSCQGRTLRIVVGEAIRRRRPRTLDNNYQKRALQPWVLATTVDNITAAHVVGLYSKRMQVEEMFRDLKNPRHGWALSHTRSRAPGRLDMLVLVATLAMVVALMVGIHAENRGLAKHFQANTERRRRVLSLVNLGRQAFAELKALPRALGKATLIAIADEQLRWLLAAAKAPHQRCRSCRPKPHWGPIIVRKRRRS